MFRWLSKYFQWTVDAARERILRGDAPPGITLNEPLRLAGESALRNLPERLSAPVIDLSDCVNLATLPGGLKCRALILRRTRVQRLPTDLEATELVDAAECRELRSVPNLRVAALVLRGCAKLKMLRTGMRLQTLDLSRCAEFSAFPDTISRLVALNVADCPKLTQLPDGLSVRSWIDIAGSGLTSLPWSLRSTRIYWRGVPIPFRVAFDPESITVGEVVNEANQALRQVLLERMGLERFVEHAKAIVVDVDSDAGGTRRLLRIPIEHGEDLTYVQVKCPSTQKRYLLRVPIEMTTCRQAIAWTAGFNNPADYRPVVET